MCNSLRMEGEQTILVVDDDEACRELHGLWLAEEHHVLKASSGDEALDDVDRADVVLLDREMPGMDGEAVARRVRRTDHDCFVVMLSGVEPDFDIVDLPVDEYLTKPVTRDDLVDVVETMLERDVRRGLLREFLSLAARKERLERRKRPTELASRDEYRELLAKLEAKRAAVCEIATELDEEWCEAHLSTVGDDIPFEGPAHS